MWANVGNFDGVIQITLEAHDITTVILWVLEKFHDTTTLQRERVPLPDGVSSLRRNISKLLGKRYEYLNLTKNVLEVEVIP